MVPEMKGGAPATSLARLTPNEAETTRDVRSLYRFHGNVRGAAGHDALSRRAYEPHPVLIQFRYGCGTGSTRHFPLLIIDGSGASGDFGPAKARSRAEDRQTAKHICFNLSRFQSLTRPTREASAAHIRTVVRRCTRTAAMCTGICTGIGDKR